jgi:hypothetical protein
LPLVGFRRRPVAGTPLLFTLARQIDGKIQLAPDVLCEFGGFKRNGFVLNPIHNPTFGHKAIVRLNGKWETPSH